MVDKSGLVVNLILVNDIHGLMINWLSLNMVGKFVFWPGVTFQLINIKFWSSKSIDCWRGCQMDFFEF